LGGLSCCLISPSKTAECSGRAFWRRRRKRIQKGRGGRSGGVNRESGEGGGLFLAEHKIRGKEHHRKKISDERKKKGPQIGGCGTALGTQVSSQCPKRAVTHITKETATRTGAKEVGKPNEKKHPKGKESGRGGSGGYFKHCSSDRKGKVHAGEGKDAANLKIGGRR